MAYLAMWLVLAIHGVPVNAQSEGELDPAAETLENGQLEAALYVIHPAQDDQKPIKLNGDSLLKWHNSVNQSVYGNIFVWTKEGRPETVASIYRLACVSEWQLEDRSFPERSWSGPPTSGPNPSATATTQT
jgi:hypothetical protein